MFHAEYFDECKELCEYLDDMKVKYVPRIIGEEPGSRNNFAHQYTDKQLDALVDKGMEYLTNEIRPLAKKCYDKVTKG